MKRAFVLVAIAAVVGVNGYLFALAVSGFMAAAAGTAGFVGEGAIFGGVALLLSAALLEVVVASGLLVFGLARLLAPGALTPRQARLVIRIGALALGVPSLIGYLISGRVFWLVLSVTASLTGWAVLRAVFWLRRRFARA